MTKVETLVPDIYDLFTDKHPKVTNLAALEEFGVNVSKVVKDAIEGLDSNNTFRLRPSNIGSPSRLLWFQSRDPDFNTNGPKQEIRFLLGHLLEQLLVFLIKESGHEVTDQQKRIKKHGLEGSLDLRVDGALVDIKSSSSFGFTKFRKNTVVEDDTWGYPHQIRFYMDEENDKKVYWLAIDKQHGELALASAHKIQLPSVKTKIKEHTKNLKKASFTEIEPCAVATPEENGNVPLPTVCTWCKYKKQCYPNLRAFKYSNGVKYFSKIEKEPRVQEIKETTDEV